VFGLEACAGQQSKITFSLEKSQTPTIWNSTGTHYPPSCIVILKTIVWFFRLRRFQIRNFYSVVQFPHKKCAVYATVRYLGVHESHSHLLVVGGADDVDLRPHQNTSRLSLRASPDLKQINRIQ
jgi:hypothetical protein